MANTICFLWAMGTCMHLDMESMDNSAFLLLRTCIHLNLLRISAKMNSLHKSLLASITQLSSLTKVMFILQVPLYMDSWATPHLKCSLYLRKWLNYLLILFIFQLEVTTHGRSVTYRHSQNRTKNFRCIQKRMIVWAQRLCFMTTVVWSIGKTPTQMMSFYLNLKLPSPSIMTQTQNNLESH